MFSSIQSITGLIFARFDVKAKIRPGVEANCEPASTECVLKCCEHSVKI